MDDIGGSILFEQLASGLKVSTLQPQQRLCESAWVPTWSLGAQTTLESETSTYRRSHSLLERNTHSSPLRAPKVESRGSVSITCLIAEPTRPDPTR